MKGSTSSSAAPIRLASFAPRRKPVQTVSASEAPAAMPGTSRRPSPWDARPRRPGPGLPAPLAAAVPPVRPLGDALAVAGAAGAGAAGSPSIQLHRPMGGETDRLPQERGAGALPRRLPKSDPSVGHRGIPGSGLRATAQPCRGLPRWPPPVRRPLPAPPLGGMAGVNHPETDRCSATAFVTIPGSASTTHRWAAQAMSASPQRTIGGSSRQCRIATAPASCGAARPSAPSAGRIPIGG